MTTSDVIEKFEVLEKDTPTYVLAEDMGLTDKGWYQESFKTIEEAYEFACLWAGCVEYQKGFEENFTELGEPFTLLSQAGPVEMSIRKVN